MLYPIRYELSFGVGFQCGPFLAILFYESEFLQGGKSW
jgi:hypothetical protein